MSEALRQGWFDVREPEAGVFAIAEPLHEEWVKSYLVVGDERALLIDTGMGVGDMRALVAELTDKPVTVVNSHAHWDHIGGNHQFLGQTEILIHEIEAPDLEDGIPNERLRDVLAADRLRGPLPPGFDLETAAFPPTSATRILQGDESFDLGGRRIDTLPAPGHSAGLLVFLDRANQILFSTDAAYAGSLTCRFPDIELAQYVTTLTTLADLAPTLRAVYPAHDESPIAPALLPRMRDGMIAVAGGRSPDEVLDYDGLKIAKHRFYGFSVLLPAA